MTYIAPFLLHHETEIDATLADLKSKGKAAGLDYMRRAYNAIASAVTNAILAVSRRVPICFSDPYTTKHKLTRNDSLPLCPVQ